MPSELCAWRVDDAELQAQKYFEQARTHAITLIGKPKSHMTAKILPWTEMADYKTPSYVRRNALYTDANSTSLKDEELRSRLRKFLGLDALTMSRLIKSPIGDIEVSHGSVEHFFDPVYKNRRDPDHLQYWPFVIPTLIQPLEIWQAPPSKEHPFERLHFFRIYRVGHQLATHFVVADETTRRVVTAYRLDDAEMRADRRRADVLRHFDW